MSDNQDALRLADDLINAFSGQGLCACAAVELRRLHDLLGKANALCRIRADRIKKLEALNAELVEALRGWMNQPEDAATYDACMARAEAALAKVEASND